MILLRTLLAAALWLAALAPAPAQSVRRRPVFATPSSAYVYDEMTDADDTLATSHTPNTGGPYEAAFDGSVIGKVLDNKAVSAGGYSVFLNSTAPPSADYDVSGEFTFPDNDANQFAGLLGRYDSSANSGYRVRLNSFDGLLQLHSVTSGAPILVGSYSTGGPLALNSTHTVRLSMQGSTIKVYLNGTEQINQTNTDHTAARKAGVYFSPSNPTIDYPQLDRFWVGAVGGSVGP